MPKHKDLKRRVRARMQKTGESYTTARAQVVRQRPEEAASSSGATADFAKLAGMSDEAVAKRTDRTWRQWVKLLDAAGAAELTHREIARLLQDEHGISGWWAQSVTGGYERIRGRREKGQLGDGLFSVNKSKTFRVPIARLYAAFGARERRRWLGDVDVKIRTATREKSMRLTWEDGTLVDVYFWDKGAGKSQVQLQHKKLGSQTDATEVRAHWTKRLKALGEMLG